jgi:hypothetical protein
MRNAVIYRGQGLHKGVWWWNLLQNGNVEEQRMEDNKRCILVKQTVRIKGWMEVAEGFEGFVVVKIQVEVLMGCDAV